MIRSITAAMAAILLLTGCLTLTPSRQTGPWTLFLDEKTGLYGYRDAEGKIRIPPKFIMAGSQQFNSITAVVEQTGEEDFQGYYLLKTGEKVGAGCLYLWDNSPDCECEGKIRFRDAETDRVGFFDARGRVVIPAEYSDARPFRNNLAVVLKDARRICPDGTPWSADSGPCEHWQWQGGRALLIDPENRVMIEDFPYTDGLDWFSLRFSEAADPDPLRESFKATDGRYVSFVNFEKAFAHWLESAFLASDTPDALERSAFTEITYWDEGAGQWQQEPKDRFLKKTGDKMLRVLGRIRNGALEYEIHGNSLGLNPFIFQSNLYAAYFDACGNHMDWQYPVFDLVVSYRDQGAGGGISHQDVFEFLRTVDGVYRLVSVSMRASP
ncbi:MAG: WG repeat-containing protein [Thermodesulfobacteriota bacterium]